MLTPNIVKDFFADQSMLTIFKLVVIHEIHKFILTLRGNYGSIARRVSLVVLSLVKATASAPSLS